MFLPHRICSENPERRLVRGASDPVKGSRTARLHSATHGYFRATDTEPALPSFLTQSHRLLDSCGGHIAVQSAYEQRNVFATFTQGGCVDRKDTEPRPVCHDLVCWSPLARSAPEICRGSKKWRWLEKTSQGLRLAVPVAPFMKCVTPAWILGKVGFCGFRWGIGEGMAEDESRANRSPAKFLVTVNKTEKILSLIRCCSRKRALSYWIYESSHVSMQPAWH